MQLKFVPSDSAYTLYDRDFLNNCASVLLYAVVGTLINVFAIGFGLYGLSCIGAMGSFNILYPNGTEQVFIPTKIPTMRANSEKFIGPNSHSYSSMTMLFAGWSESSTPLPA